MGYRKAGKGGDYLDGSRWEKGKGNVRVYVEKHAVCFSVAEALALRVGLARCAARRECVLRPRRVKVVRSRVFGVSDNSASRGGCSRAH